MCKTINILEYLQDGRAQHAPANFGGAIEYTGWHVAHAGGNVNNGDQAGFATLNANNSSSNRNTNTGSHVCILTSLSGAISMALPLGKTHILTPFGAGSLRANAPGTKQTGGL